MEKEKMGFRDEAYSRWHRTESSQRFLGRDASRLGMVDIDAVFWIEYERSTNMPLALIETAIWWNSDQYKNAAVLTNLAKRASLPCFLVLYELSESDNPVYPEVKDIDRFHVKRLWKPPVKKTIFTPEEYAEFLLKLREITEEKLRDEWLDSIIDGLDI